jgi:hypothetical protein
MIRLGPRQRRKLVLSPSATIDARTCSVRRISTKRRSRSSRPGLLSFAVCVEASSHRDSRSDVSIVELGRRSGDPGGSGGGAPTVRLGVSAAMASRFAAVRWDSNSRNHILHISTPNPAVGQLPDLGPRSTTGKSVSPNPPKPGRSLLFVVPDRPPVHLARLHAQSSPTRPRTSRPLSSCRCSRKPPH